MKWLLNCMLVVSLCLFSFCSVASNMRFERLTAEQGLSQMSVNAVLQDNQGFMWFGTQDGLNRYDGYQFKIYRSSRDDLTSLASNWVNALYEDNDGNLWVGTNKGLHKYDRRSDSFKRYVHKEDDVNTLSGNTVFAITQDQQGDLWLACFGDGVSRFDPITERFTRYVNDAKDPNSLSTGRATAVLVDSNNTPWISLFGGGLNRFNRKTNQFERFVHQPDDPNSINNDSVLGLFEDSKQRLWVGTRKGLNHFDRANNRFIRYPIDEDGENILIWTVFEDSKQQLWLGSGAKGLFKFDAQTGQTSHFVHDSQDHHSIGSNRVRSIVEDRSGMLWIGARVGGVNKYNPSTANFRHYKNQPDDPNSLRDNTIWSLYEDSQGLIWVGSAFNGLSSLDPKTNQFIHYKNDPQDKNSITNNQVMAMVEDHRGDLWLGTQTNGLERFNRKTGVFSHYIHNPNDSNSLTQSARTGIIIEDSQHFLWIGTDKGLNRLDPTRKQFVHFVHDPKDPSSLASNNIMALQEDSDGSLWVGTADKGLAHFDRATGKFKHYRHDPDNPDSLNSDVIYSIYQGSDDILWVGTESGIDRFNPSNGIFTHYNHQQGLSNDTVFGIMGDQAGFLWITTNNGLNRFDPCSETFNVYKFSDGIQHNEFSAGAYSVTRSGQVLAGGINGFNVFYPQDVTDDLTEPAMVFTDFLLNNNEVEIDSNGIISPLTAQVNELDSVVLTHENPVFTFEFSGLHFASPTQNNYAYQLVGFDRLWVYTDSKHRRATYTNLDPGRYLFKVKGSNSDMMWSSESKQISVTILPPPWRTWWAYVAYFIAVLLPLLLVVYLLMQKREAERQAADSVSASEHQLSLALWGSGDQLWDWDKSKGVVQRRNVLSDFVLPAQQKATELDPEVFFIHPDDRDGYTQALLAHHNGEIDHLECAYRLKDKLGQWRWVLDRGKIVETDRDNNITRMTGTLQDIHDMHEAEESLIELNETLEHKVGERTQALQDSLDQLKAAQQQLIETEKMAALGNLVAGVAHEVNTPLGICITMVSLHLEKLRALNKQVDEGKMTRKSLDTYLDESEQSQVLAESNLHRAAELVQSFKKVAVDQVADTFDEIVFHDYLRDIIRSIVPRLKNTKIDINLVSDGDWSIATYPGAWWQILSSLVENSLTHGFLGKPSGEIVISAERIDDRLHMIYRDNGHGLTDEAQDKIYEPFYTTARERGNTGLGMHVVFNLVVQKLEGDISCDSQPDKGVIFRIDVPV